MCLERPPRATASGRTAEDTMNDELAARQRAISLRLAGRPVKHICSALGRSEAWFHKGWGRYLQAHRRKLSDLGWKKWESSCSITGCVKTRGGTRGTVPKRAKMAILNLTFQDSKQTRLDRNRGGPLEWDCFT